MNFDDAMELLKHSWVALAAVLAWIGKKHLSDDKEAQKSADKRLAALERDRATRADIERIHERIDELGRDMNQGHREILQTLVDWRAGK